MDRLSLSRASVYELVLGPLRSIKIGKARRVLESDLDEYIRSLSSRPSV